MFLSLTFLLLDGIKALGITLTGLTPSASFGSQCSLYSALLLPLVLFIQSFIVFFSLPLWLQCLSHPCHFLHKYCFFSPTNTLIESFLISLFSTSPTHTHASTQTFIIWCHLYYFFILVSEMPFSVDLPILWHLKCRCIIALEKLLPSDSIFDCRAERISQE